MRYASVTGSRRFGQLEASLSAWMGGRSGDRGLDRWPWLRSTRLSRYERLSGAFVLFNADESSLAFL